MGRPLIIPWRDSVEELEQRYRHERHQKRRQRLNAFWLLRQGLGLNEVSAAVGVHYTTLQRWIAWYRHGGLAEVLHRTPGHSASGKTARLSPSQQQALQAQVVAGRFHTVREVLAWVEAQWGVRYTYDGMNTLLRRQNLGVKVSRSQAEQRFLVNG